jgi:hypothetical protein
MFGGIGGIGDILTISTRGLGGSLSFTGILNVLARCCGASKCRYCFGNCDRDNLATGNLDADCCKADVKGVILDNRRGCPPRFGCCFCFAVFCDFILLYTILYIGMVDIIDLQNKEQNILNNLNIGEYKSLIIGHTTYYVIKENILEDGTTYSILYTETDNNKLYYSKNNSLPLQLFTDGTYPLIYISLLNQITNDNRNRGGKKAPTAPAYKLNGEKVSLLINKKKLHRSVYVKGNGNDKAKYCKINYEFVLLSKLKNKIL